jgi:uncharacterized repeat protein (TIGR01451 family)
MSVGRPASAWAGAATSALLLLLALALAVPAPAGAADRLVTFAARVCDDYPDISANRARNDIQESLRDLGRDTTYVAGEAIQPAKELSGQPNCRPLPDWRFTLGTDYASRASTGPWGALTVLTRTFPTRIVTQASTPLLDVAGRDTGETLAGAVTLRLTDEQARLAATGSGLWLQGGTPDDPVLDRLYPSQYGFGALRCAIDNLNGDNVEWIAYPTGARHVFCYAYYVTPPPTSGTIVVRKVVDDPDATAPTAFRFEGNVSYTEDRSFTLNASAREAGAATFYRAATGAGDAPWTVSEVPQDGWRLAELTCTSSSGRSVTAADTATGSASISLAAGDTVTCTYVNTLAPPPAGLELAKRTLGAIGSFGFTIGGDGVDERRTLKTTSEDSPVATGLLSLPAGRYVVDETSPAPTGSGRWRLDEIVCDGVSQGRSLPLTIALTAGAGRFCEFVNRFEPAGSITLRKITVGGTGTVGFAVFRHGDPSFLREQEATTRSPGTEVRATGDDLGELELGRYTIVETGPAPDPGGEWSVETVFCNGLPYPSAQGRIEIQLTAAAPELDCLYVNRFRATPEPPVDPPEPPEPPTPPVPTPPTPPAPPTPTPPSGGVAGLVRASRPRADLRVTKRVSTPVTTVGRLVRYRIVVTNRGPDTARNVSGTEFGPRARDVVGLRISRGRCHTRRRPIVCRVPALRPGRRIVVQVLVRAQIPRRLVNHVAVSTSTADPNLRNNRAHAALVIRRAASAPSYTG